MLTIAKTTISEKDLELFFEDSYIKYCLEKDKIDKDDLIENNWTGQKNQLPDSLGHVSSAKDLTSAKYLQMFDGAVATGSVN